ncbi:MAG TPA: DUF3307 domain-containing protein [Thermotogota bacterium]|nr:DUF3307 domain-containing protein [Thermotogota bacterium]HRW92270.1 DUF3307 domain-containing protein [Thermotogota bacterium]
MRLFFLALLAHMLGDFVFQTSRTVSRREEGKAGAFVAHGVVHFATLGVLLIVFGYSAVSALFFAAWIALLHLAVDLLKNLFTRKATPGKKLLGFGIDQAVHLLVLWVFCNGTNLVHSPSVLQFLSRTFLGQGTASGEWMYVQDIDRGLAALAIGIATTLGGAVLMPLFLDWFYRNVPGYRQKVQPAEHPPTEISKEVQTGKLVGILERFLLFVLMLMNQFSAMAFIIGAKSLARFKQLNDRDFAEYYLIGTLASVAIAVLGAVVFKWFFNG